ncbi:MAG: ZIP family metal transporter [Armatimonadota bacterium]
MSAAALGGLLASGSKKINHRTLCGLVSFAAGALLGVTIISIIPETFEMLGIIPAIVCLVVGTLIFAAIGKYVYYMCPACAASATEHDGGYLRLGILMMVAMGIHSTVDGLAISAGSEAAKLSSTSAAGLLILFAVSYHKIPEGMALVSVARLGGYSRFKAFIVTVLIELTTALGAFIGMFFLNGVDKVWLGITMGIVAGSFIYTVGFALLKEMYAHEKNSIIIYVVLGFLSMVILNLLMIYTGIGGHAH